MNIYPYDAVVFDLDGTLFDAEEGITSSAVAAVTEMGFAVPEDADLRAIVGPPLQYSFRTIFRLPEERIHEAIERYRRIFAEQGIEQYSVYPHIRSILQMLGDAGVHVGMATSKATDVALAVMDHFGMSHYFDRIVGEDGAEAHLGKPELIRRALPDKAQHPVMVGDRKYDILGAKEVGVEAIGVSYGCGSEQELMDAGATHIVPDTEALRALLCPGGEIPRGFFLTVEGVDGSGKSTQVDLLEKSLRQYGFGVVRTREPGGCDISEDIRRIVLDPRNMEMCDECEALLYAAARAQHVRQVIRPAVERGMLVLCDRFVDSSIAYQGAGRELGMDAVQQINALAVGDMQPDATLFLHIDHKRALARRLAVSEPDRIEVGADDFQARVEEGYDRLARANRKRYLVVDADQPIAEVAHDALSAVLNRLEPSLRREA